jgi:hypothetical protein
MFLVEDARLGTPFLVFTWRDPRDDGYTGRLNENVILDNDSETVPSWPDGAARPDACLGQAPDDAKHYKVFKYESDRRQAGFHPIAEPFAVFLSWSDYDRFRLIPPDPEQTPDEDWYDYLDKLDEGARRRRRRPDELGQPKSKDREAIAAWVARNHFIADSGVREVWYLPKGAPPDEIRLLELSDRLPGNESKVEAIDFGLDIEGMPFRLVVADVTTDQLEQVKEDPSRLPKGWSLDENRIWSRRGA